MSYILYTGEMIHALRTAGDTELADAYEESYIDLNRRVAESLARKLGIETDPETRMDDGRVAASCHPLTKGQPLPEAIEGFDNDDEWDPE